MLVIRPLASLRNGAEAVRLAQRAVALAGPDDPRALDTLAVASAEGGDFLAAMEAGQKALKLAQASGDRDLASELAIQLRLFQSGSPYHGR